MRIFIDFKNFEDTFKQIESIFKQDKSLKTENKTVVMYINSMSSEEIIDIPIFFRTKSVQVCQPLSCKSVENEVSQSLELNIPEVIGILNTFKAEKTPPSEISLEYEEDSAYTTITVFVPQGEATKGNEPVCYFFNLKHTTPLNYIMTEFLNDMSDSSIKYQNLSIVGLSKVLKSLAEGYKYIPKHITGQIYVRFNQDYIYMRTAMGLIAYINKFPVFHDINLMEDSVKLLNLISMSFEKVYFYNDEKRAKLYIQTGTGGGTFIFNYRTGYNEDSVLMSIFKLTSKKETITLDRGAFERNFRRLSEDSKMFYFLRQRGTSKILCDVSTRVMQSLLIKNKIGNLIDNIALKLTPIMLKSSLVPLTTSESEEINFHFGTQDGKTVTIGLTDSNKDWYSLLSVSCLYGEEYEELIKEYEKYKF